jgi:hypothetical protein
MKLVREILGDARNPQLVQSRLTGFQDVQIVAYFGSVGGSQVTPKQPEFIV